MESGRGEASHGGSAKQLVKRQADTSGSIIARCSKRPGPISGQIGSKENRPPFITRAVEQIGRSVDIHELLFTAERDFLVKSNGEQVRAVDLEGKTVVLVMFPLDPRYLWGEYHPDVIDAYSQLLRMGSGVEFVLVPLVPLVPHPLESRHPISSASQAAVFDALFPTIPFPAIPFSDVEACGGRVRGMFPCGRAPSWVVIDPTNKVVATRQGQLYENLFKHYGGDQLYPLSPEAIRALPLKYREQVICEWDQLLASDGRDFLLSSNGDKVPISSLKGRVIGLYFCENMRPPPRMQVINKVYEEARSRGYDFEIVQITFHYHFFNAIQVGTNPTVEPCLANISWLTLPFKDPSVRRLQHIFNCGPDDEWDGDCLVILDTRQDDIVFEFSGAEIFEAYGVEAYPFTRSSLYEKEYARQKREVRLQSLFPPGKAVDASQLAGKRVLVLLADCSIYEFGREYMSMLETKYHRGKDYAAAEEDKFEVVYVSTDSCESSFEEYKKTMPWVVHPYSPDFASYCACTVFNFFECSMVSAAAFDKDGELVAKDLNLVIDASLGEEHRQFPFIASDLKMAICGEVGECCKLLKYYTWPSFGIPSDLPVSVNSWR